MKNNIQSINKKVSKAQIAKDMGISRSTLYHKAKRAGFDEEMKNRLK